jgi:hypothetical protein
MMFFQHNPKSNNSAGDALHDALVYNNTPAVGSSLVTALSGQQLGEVVNWNFAAPLNAGSDATIDAGGQYLGGGSFLDTRGHTWTAQVDYADGASWESLSLGWDSGQSLYSFALDHTYATAGTYVVKVRATNEEGVTIDDSVVVTVADGGEQLLASESGQALVRYIASESLAAQPVERAASKPKAVDYLLASEAGKPAGVAWGDRLERAVTSLLNDLPVKRRLAKANASLQEAIPAELASVELAAIPRVDL